MDGKSLFKAMAKEIPELILLDIMLPGEDGYSILARLKSDPDTRNIPVILVTARESEFDKVKGLDGGAKPYYNRGRALSPQDGYSPPFGGWSRCDGRKGRL